MQDITVYKFAEAVGIPIDRLLAQLKEAGLPQTRKEELFSDDDKLALLQFLRQEHEKRLRSEKKVVHVIKKKAVSKATNSHTKATRPTEAKKVFLSYAWDDANHNKWVKQLANRLRTDGIEALLDRWELHPGDEITGFMEKSIAQADFVILICTPKYKKKADEREGGVGYEGAIISSELYQKSNQRKFIPILRSGTWDESGPSYAVTKLYIDLRESDAETEEESYRDLLITLLGRRERPPKVGSATIDTNR